MRIFGNIQVIKTAILLANSLVVLGCASTLEENNSSKTPREFSIEVSSCFPRTKTIISDNGSDCSFNYLKGDKIGFFAEEILVNVGLTCYNEELGSFTGTIRLHEPGQTEYRETVNYYAYYPYSANAGNDASHLNGVLPSTQSAPYDCSADYMISDKVQNKYDIDDFPSLSLSFANHLFAIVKLSVINTSDEYSGERILSIGLNSSSAVLAGDFSFSVSDASSEAEFSDNLEKRSNKVKVAYSSDACPVIGKDITHSVYAIVNPAAFSAGELQLIVTTTDHIFRLSTTKDVLLSRSCVNVLPAVDIADAKVEAQVDAKSITFFKIYDGINNYEAFDYSNGVVSIQVPNGLAVNDMTVTFEHTGTTITVDGTEQISGAKGPDFSDFSSPVKYVVTSSAGEQQEYEIRLFDLPLVEVETPGRQVIDSKEVWIPVDEKDPVLTNITIWEVANDGKRTSTSYTAQIRGRGNATWRQVKKPYTFKLSSKASVLEMPADKRWNLLANWYDRTVIRNDVTLEIARNTEGMDWSPHGRFVELIVNGEFLGNYYLCEHIKISKDRVNIQEMKTTDTSPEAITGGYLLEYDYRPDSDRYFSSSIIVNSAGSGYTRIKVKDPEDDGFDLQWAWIENYVHELEAILSNPDALAAHRYTEYMDIDSYIDWWLVHEISGNIEPIGPASCYMYKDRGGKLKAGPAWDFDLYTYRRGLTGWFIKNTLYYSYLFQDPYFVNRVKEKWPQLKQNLQGVSDYIDQITGIVSRSAARNAKMWPIKGSSDNGDETLTVPEASARLKAAYEARILEMDGLINALEANPVDSNSGNENYGDQTTPDFGFGF